MPSLSDILQTARPREKSGSQTASRYDFQSNYAILRLIELHQQDQDYRLVLDLYDDVAILNSAEDPTEIRLYQIKSKAKAFFADNLALASKDLDVRLPENAAKSIQGTNIGRGSEGPRALTAYYYAFLQTARKFGSSAFCPIVVDAPNQQGQDRSHLDQIMQFLLTEMPHDSQLIVATESISKAASQEATVLQLSARKNQVLNSDEYETVSNYMNQYLSQLLLL